MATKATRGSRLRAGHAYPQVGGRAAVLPGEARAINCTAVSLIAAGALLNIARARPVQKTPAPIAYAASQKILGGGQRASAPSKVLRGPSTPGRELFGGHAEIKDAGRGLARFQPARIISELRTPSRLWSG